MESNRHPSPEGFEIFKKEYGQHCSIDSYFQWCQIWETRKLKFIGEKIVVKLSAIEYNI